MKFEGLSPLAIASVLGQRIKQARLNKNLTQSVLAAKAGVSRTAVTYVEQGKSTLETTIAVLIALGLAEQLDLFIPEQQISPIQYSKLQRKKRQRASTRAKDGHKTNANVSEQEPPEW